MERRELWERMVEEPRVNRRAKSVVLVAQGRQALFCERGYLLGVDGVDEAMEAMEAMR
jgi:hypothetical protein